MSLITKKIGNHLMYLDLAESVGSKLIKNGYREAAFMKIISREVAPGMIAMDIGANIGYVTLALAELVGKTGKVYAFEPAPLNFETLSKNINLNGYGDFVFPIKVAISNTVGTAEFFLSRESNIHGLIKTNKAVKTINVDVTTVDKFVESRSCPNFIKMDIEGHEVEALEGMYESLKNTESVKILIEVHPRYYNADHSLKEQLLKFIDIGFNTKYVISAGIGKPEFFAKNGYKPDEVIATDGFERGIYTNISNEHMLEAACQKHANRVPHRDYIGDKIVRAILIEKN